jgi:hypothetical protein
MARALLIGSGMTTTKFGFLIREIGHIGVEIAAVAVDV